MTLPNEIPLEDSERTQWVELAQRCTQLHSQWYEHDQLHEPRPQLFNHWRPLSSNVGMPLEAGLISWHELEVEVHWLEGRVDLRVMIPDGTKVTVTERDGPWNAVARFALDQMQQLAGKLQGQIPPPRRLTSAPARRQARQRMKLAEKIMAQRLPEDEA